MATPMATGENASGSPQHTLSPGYAGPGNWTNRQLWSLLQPVNANRVQRLNGFSHMEAWDIRRWLIRIFGFGGFSIETMELTVVHQHNQGNRWWVVYRAQVRLTVKDHHGRPVAIYEDAAAGAGQNQPNLADAHDMGMKTALSQALKRCAVNLGDEFGLSLYNNGSKEAVVGWSAAHPKPEEKATEEALPEDPPVEPEPGPLPEPTSQASPPPSLPGATARQDAAAQVDTAQPPVTADDIRRQARQGQNNVLACRQTLIAAQQSGTAGEPMWPDQPDSPTIGQALTARITDLAAEQQRQRRNSSPPQGGGARRRQPTQ